MKEEIQAVFDLFKLIYFILFASHFCACAWYFLGIVEIDKWGYQNCWFTNQNLFVTDDDWLTKYLFSLYWSTITTLTIGYGDITPTTNPERIFVIAIALIMTGVLGYSISNVGEIFK